MFTLKGRQDQEEFDTKPS